MPARFATQIRAVWSLALSVAVLGGVMLSGCQWRPWRTASTPPPISGGSGGVAQASDDASAAADSVAWASAGASDEGVQQTPFTATGDIAPPPLPAGDARAVSRPPSQPRVASQVEPTNRGEDTVSLPPPSSANAWPMPETTAANEPPANVAPGIAPPSNTTSLPPIERELPAASASNSNSWTPAYRTAARPQVDAPPAAEAPLTPPPTAREAAPGPGNPLAVPPLPGGTPPAASRYGDVPPTAAPPATSQQPIAPPAPFPSASSPSAVQPGVTPGLEISAAVGNEIILKSDVVPDVDQILRDNADKIPASQIDEIRAQLMERRKKYLTDLIETKQVLVEMRRNVPEEGFTRVLANVERKFEEVEVPDLMKRTETGTRVELIKKMGETSNSFEQYKKAWIDKSLASAWVGQKFGDYQGKEPTHEDLWQYYQEHEKDFQFPAKARWQEITVSYGTKRSRQQAWDLLGQLWQEVKNGKPFEQVAKESSEGPTATSGGARDWISQGSHRSETMDQALFTWPVAQLSTGIEDEGAFHIIVVTERRSAGQTAFPEVQADIREKLKKADRAAKVKEYLEKVRTTVPVRLHEDIDLDLDAPIVPNDE